MASAVKFLGVSPNSFSITTRSIHVAAFRKQLTCFSFFRRSNNNLLPSSPSPNLLPNSVVPNGVTKDVAMASPIHSPLPLSGLEDVMMSYIFGKTKATEVAQRVWKHVVQKGDTLVDATCGNGHDTLAMIKMVADKSQKARVYAMDVQRVALENTSSLLDESLNPDEKEIVELLGICHSKMEEVIQKGTFVRLVAFNLGYLPGGDKSIITSPETTLRALEAAKRILAPGGLISVVVYVGHPGGREEFDTVQAFASRLPVESWTCCKLQMLNRPLAPVLVFIFKRS